MISRPKLPESPWVEFHFFCADGSMPRQCPPEFRQGAVRVSKEAVSDHATNFETTKKVAARSRRRNLVKSSRLRVRSYNLLPGYGGLD